MKMSGEFKAVLFVLFVFVLIFTNILKDRNYESEDENVD